MSAKQPTHYQSFENVRVIMTEMPMPGLRAMAKANDVKPTRTDGREGIIGHMIQKMTELAGRNNGRVRFAISPEGKISFVGMQQPKSRGGEVKPPRTRKPKPNIVDNFRLLNIEECRDKAYAGAYRKGTEASDVSDCPYATKDNSTLSRRFRAWWMAGLVAKHPKLAPREDAAS